VSLAGRDSRWLESANKVELWGSQTKVGGRSLIRCRGSQAIAVVGVERWLPRGRGHRTGAARGVDAGQAFGTLLPAEGLRNSTRSNWRCGPRWSRRKRRSVTDLRSNRSASRRCSLRSSRVRRWARRRPTRRCSLTGVMPPRGRVGVGGGSAGANNSVQWPHDLTCRSRKSSAVALVTVPRVGVEPLSRPSESWVGRRSEAATWRRRQRSSPRELSSSRRVEVELRGDG
jgi:hypothetical protein